MVGNIYMVVNKVINDEDKIYFTDSSHTFYSASASDMLSSIINSEISLKFKVMKPAATCTAMW